MEESYLDAIPGFNNGLEPGHGTKGSKGWQAGSRNLGCR